MTESTPALPAGAAPGARPAPHGARVGDPLELAVGQVAAGGACVARSPAGQVVFVRHALPGERVRAVVREAARSYLRADAIEVLEASPHRVAPPCPAAGPGRCGGCDFQHVALDEQRRLKAALVAEQLRRLAHLDCAVHVEAVPGAPDGLSWRTRARFAIDPEGRPGLHRHRSHEIEHVAVCPLVTSGVARAGVLEAHWPGTSVVEVFAPPGARPHSARPHGASAHRDEADGAALVRLEQAGRGRAPVSLPRLAPSLGVVERGRTRRPPGALEVPVGRHALTVSAGSFWQVHAGAPGLLAEVVRRGLDPRPGERAADLYAGVGLFTLVLADAVGPTGRVVALERHRRASADARLNTAGRAEIEVREEAVTPRSLSRLGPLDLVVLDPPRAGAGTALVRALCALDPAPRRVAYVACDPASFARDLATALAAGWSLAELRAFDLFPMTEHVELVAFLEPPAPEPPARPASEAVRARPRRPGESRSRAG